MASRPRRSAAKKAHEAITDWADSERTPNMSTRSRRPDGASNGRSSGVTRDPPSSPGHESLNLTVKVPANKLREATSGRSRNSGASSLNARENFVGGEIIAGKRNRGAKKSYVVESDSDEEDEDEEMADLGDDDDMEVDADGDDDEDDEDDADGDADGDVDMDATPAHPTTIKIQTPKSNKVTVRRPAASRVVEEEEDDDDDELSEIEVSDPEVDMSINVGGVGDDDDEEEDQEEDAEGEEEDAEGEEEEEEEEEDAEGEADDTMNVTTAAADDFDSDEDGSQTKELDVNKMTRRQRARFEDEPQEYMKLSDEVQVKKHLTAEELSMRRSEMARRRRNLSEKRNEEVKVRPILIRIIEKTSLLTCGQMETINKLLKKQAPKTNRKAQDNQAGDDKPNAMFVRWVSTKEGSRIAVPDEMLGGSAGKVFGAPTLRTGKIVEEVQ
ncbi:hypothetical protein ACHAQH_000004 [Verticillium albo-atrum]